MHKARSINLLIFFLAGILARAQGQEPVAPAQMAVDDIDTLPVALEQLQTIIESRYAGDTSPKMKEFRAGLREMIPFLRKANAVLKSFDVQQLRLSILRNYYIDVAAIANSTQPNSSVLEQLLDKAVSDAVQASSIVVEIVNKVTPPAPIAPNAPPAPIAPNALPAGITTPPQCEASGIPQHYYSFHNSTLQPTFDRSQFESAKTRLLLLHDEYPNSPERAIPCNPHTALWVNFGANNISSWTQSFAVAEKGLQILLTPDDIEKSRQQGLIIAVNGHEITSKLAGTVFGSRDVPSYHVEIYANNPTDCRRYSPDAQVDSLDIVVRDSTSINKKDPVFKAMRNNGIVVSAPKVYDSYLLRAKLKTAADQLAAINPWSAAAITNAYGSVQGITRDVSYLAAQATATPVPQVVSTANGPLNPNAAPVQTQQVTTVPSCPPGYVAVAMGTSAGAPGFSCTALASGTTGGPSSITTTTLSSPNPATLQTQTTQAAQSPVAPSAPASTALSVPSGVNAAYSPIDTLAQQVQLNAQLQMYQTLLQGAQSDQLLIRNSRAIANRAQTTIGFSIYLDPPRQLRRAVAEVRIMLIPHRSANSQPAPGSDKATIVNLLPSQRTYNVAKITSKQNQFSGGAIIDQVVNVGLNTGKSKDRLYLAKESDTVSLQYMRPDVDSIGRPLPERVWEGLRAIDRLWTFDKGPNLPPAEDLLDVDPNSIVAFGWQFRPVLDADYVAAGNHDVFAQIALPEALEEDGYAPAVWVQTIWREYDVRHQAVGPYFRNDWGWMKIQDAISIITPLKVKDVTVDDVGGGTLKVRAQGDFYEPGVTLMTANTSISPTSFDGKTIQFFALAHDLVQNGRMELVGENGRPVELKIPVRGNLACGVAKASLTATPYPDGTSWAKLSLEFKDVSKSELTQFHPLALIGSDLYGLNDKPFLNGPNCDESALKCDYQFQAATASIRAARSFLVRDVAWGTARSGTIIFGPSFASLAALNNDSSGAGAPIPAAPVLTGIVNARPDPPVSLGDWTIEQMQVHVSAATVLLNPAIAKGDQVNVFGTRQAANAISASAIGPASAPSFTGTISTLPASPKLIGDWTVGLFIVHVSEKTKTPTALNSIAKGIQVNVSGKRNDDGSIDASEVSLVAAPPTPVWYALSGTGLSSLTVDCKADSAPQCTHLLEALDTSGKLTPVDQNMLQPLSDSIVLFRFDGDSKAIKSLKLVWTPPVTLSTDHDLPIAWDLAIPSPAPATSVSPAPAILSKGDGRTITFKGLDFSGVKSVQFESLSLTFKASGSSIDITIPTALTATTGYKEILATGVDGKGNATQTKLSVLILPTEALPNTIP